MGVSEEITVRTDDNELTLEEMSGALPDTSTIMARVGQAWWHLIYAARGGNWGLTGYYLRRVVKLENTLKVLRPKHRERLERFQAEAMPEVIAAVETQDLTRLEVAYATATDMANALHSESGYPYIRWELPKEPPQGLRLDSVGEDSVDEDYPGKTETPER
jgi:hypothetical protein